MTRMTCQTYNCLSWCTVLRNVCLVFVISSTVTCLISYSGMGDDNLGIRVNKLNRSRPGDNQVHRPFFWPRNQTTAKGKVNFLQDLTTLMQEIDSNRAYRDALMKGIQTREGLRTTDWNTDETQYSYDTQFLKYLSCQTSVRKMLATGSYFQHRYMPEVPILMWDKHYNAKEYARLSKYQGIYGWNKSTESEIASALHALNTSSNEWLFDEASAGPNDGCRRCAVIGNGGILNGSKKGSEIDAHEYVFRVNVAVTEGHEEDVGTKTSFYCAAFRSLSNSLMSGRPFGFKAPPYQKGIRYVFFPKTKWAYLYLNAVLSGQEAPNNPVDGRSPPNFPKALTAEDVKLVHPDFERYLKFKWVNSSRKYHEVHRPSTGAIMLLLALHTCDEVNVYGFAGSYEKYSEYYYDTKFRKHVQYANHDSNAEKELWITLHNMGIINLYTRQ
ncbi:alpha-N-acetylgalactosaminide alpha-2,6-sialyltransferase 2-like isoform X2 [Asterias amurensis]|uniref:alpha-N-acetylgalactosaminide alpha-2,6-sialyltransferase 2-like isoform X2 n=1 Tax=Asterias amurensis TaxID=7602 RepID=UPI003AB209D5